MTINLKFQLGNEESLDYASSSSGILQVRPRENKKRNEDLHQQLIEIIKHHQDILEYASFLLGF